MSTEATPPEPASDKDDEPVEKIPYGRGLKLDQAMLFRIVATLALLILIVVSARPCANATSNFVNDFDDKKGSASDTMPKPGNVDQLGPEYEYIGPNATEEEKKAAYERARAKAREAAGKGSAGSGSAGSGSAGSGSADRGSADRGSADRGSADRGSADRGSADATR